MAGGGNAGGDCGGEFADVEAVGGEVGGWEDGVCEWGGEECDGVWGGVGGVE